MLKIKQLNADGKFGLYNDNSIEYPFSKSKYSAALPYIQGKKNEKGKELPKPSFVTTFESIFANLKIEFKPIYIIKMMQKCEDELFEEENKSKEPIPIPVTSLQFEQIINLFPEFRRNDMRIILSVAGQKSGSSDPAWMFIISPPSSGKTYALEKLNHPNLSYMLDDFTLNALAPGRPNKDAAEVESVFEQAAHKNLIINDLSSIMNQSDDKVKSFIGSITAAYGLRYRKASPGGKVDIETDFTLIAGITPATYQKHKKIMAELGARVLFMWFTPPEFSDSVFKETISKEELTQHICGYLLDCKEHPIEVIIPSEVYTYLHHKIHQIILMRNLRWSKNIRSMEGQSRLENQMLNLIKSYCNLSRCSIATIDIVDTFLPIMYETIPYEDHLIAISRGLKITFKNRQTKAILQNAIEFDMVNPPKEEQLITPDPFKIEYTWKDEYLPIITYMSQFNKGLVAEEKSVKLAAVTNEFGDSISVQDTLSNF